MPISRSPFVGPATYAKVAGLGIAAAIALSPVVLPRMALADEITVADDVPVVEAAALEVETAGVDQDTGVFAAGSVTSLNGAEVLTADPDVNSADTTITTTGAEDLAVSVDGTSSDAPNEAAPSESSPVETAEPAKETAASDGAAGLEESETADVAIDNAQQETATTQNIEPRDNTQTASSSGDSSDQTVTTSALVTQAAGSTSTTASSASSTAINVFRMYNPNSGEHFYTSSEYEALSLFGIGWRWEGVSYKADSKTGSAVYRLYNPNAGNHFYTTDKAESDYVARAGWNYEGIAWYASGSTALYRLYNPNDGTHVYTSSAAERDNVIKAGWNYEGTSWSVMDGYIPLANVANHMVWSSAYGSYERYWIASNAAFATNRLVQASENQLGYAVYATSTGALARNAHLVVSQVVYDAANDGRLTIATSLRGIDIASYQASMNTANVDADFVIVKATQGTSYTNPYLTAQANGAYNSGKLLGLYHYASTNYGGGDPTAEAEYFISKAAPYLGRAVLVLDWEGTSNSNFGSNDATYIKTFLDRVYERTGIKGLVYMSRSVTNSHDFSSVSNAGYGLWVAQYLYYDGSSQYPAYTSTPKTNKNPAMTTWTSGMTGSWSSPTIYQYSSEGHVSGYSDEVDLNVFYSDSGAWTKLASRA